ncbi:MAG: YIP1 family protein [candidate division Zixibacteria bacterium]|nr:YIP1 family protein [candidate division Zixibacteria bacterium]
MERDNRVESTSVMMTKNYSISGLFEVFYNPSKLFGNVNYNPKILIPYFAYGILMFLFYYATADYIVKMQMESPAFQQRFDNGMPSNMTDLMKYNVIIFGSLLSLIIPIISTCFAIFFGNLVYGTKEKFKKVFSVVIFSAFIIAVGKIIVLPMIFAKESVMVSLSPAILVSHLGADSFLYVLFSKLDLFIIWEIIVAGIGFSIIYNLPRNKGYMLSVLSVGMISIIHILYTALGELL